MQDPNILDAPEEKIKYRQNFFLTSILSFAVFVLGFTSLYLPGTRSGSESPFVPPRLIKTKIFDVFGYSISSTLTLMVIIITISAAIIVGSSYKVRSYFWIMTHIVLTIIISLPVFINISQRFLPKGRWWTSFIHDMDKGKVFIFFITISMICGTGLYLGFKKKRWISCILLILFVIFCFEPAIIFLWS